MLLIPENVSPAGSLRLPALVMTLGLAASMLLCMWTRAVATVDPLNIALVSPVYWLLLDVLQGSYDLLGVSPEAVSGAFVAIGLYGLGVHLAATRPTWEVPRVVRQPARCE